MYCLQLTGLWLVQIECSATGLCPGTTALTLTTVTAPVISLVDGTYLSGVVEVKQVSMHDMLFCMSFGQVVLGKLLPKGVAFSLLFFCMSLCTFAPTTKSFRH